MIIIDDMFRPRNVLIYPPGNKKTFEEYFYDEYVNLNIKSDRIYIPIFWTNYYISKNYGRGDLSEIQKILDSLDRTKKYFTIIQYDDNILNDISDLDIVIFSQGGFGSYKNKSYVIPLNCQSNIIKSNIKRDIFASFVGRRTHNIRNDIFELYKNKEGYLISDSIEYNQFIDIMSRSTFSLCPRGYGLTSFRICESLQFGSIPVYIYDDEFLPFNDEFDFNDIGVIIKMENIKYIDDILKSNIQNIERFRKNGEEAYYKYYDYKGLFNSILKKLAIL